MNGINSILTSSYVHICSTVFKIFSNIASFNLYLSFGSTDNPLESTASISPSKKRSHGTSNCYNIQEGKIIETHRPRCRYLSPVRTKNKTLFGGNSSSNNTTTTNSSTPIINKKISQQPQLSPTTTEPSFLHRNDQKGLTTSGGTIPYREKKNPLPSTRLSCYKPKIPITLNLPHYKSVDDFMFLNSEDLNTTESDASPPVIEISDIDMFTKCRSKSHRSFQEPPDDNDDVFSASPSPPATPQRPAMGQLHHQLHQQRPKNTHSTPVDVTHDETYGFAAAVATTKTKSVENLCDQIEKEVMRRNSSGPVPVLNATPANKKRIASALSNRFRLMSNRTQRLFQRFVHNQNDTKPVITPSTEQVPSSGLELPTSLTTCKSRRSLSYGNLPDIDDFRLEVTKASEQQQYQSPSQQHIDLNETIHRDDLICNMTKTLDALSGGSGSAGEDADSGILVNESGQSSIVETADDHNVKFLETCPSMDGTNKPPNEYQCVRIRIHDDDERSLGVVLTPVARPSDNIHKRIGYMVTVIHSGGLVDR